MSWFPAHPRQSCVGVGVAGQHNPAQGGADRGVLPLDVDGHHLPVDKAVAGLAGGQQDLILRPVDPVEEGEPHAVEGAGADLDGKGVAK